MPSLTCLRDDLLSIYRAGLEAVNGAGCVARTLKQCPPRQPVHLLAIGKAAAAMSAGASGSLGEQLQRALLIAPAGHLDPELCADRRFVCLEASHPVPDERSLAAGQALIRFLDSAPADVELLVLVSGGASSLVEVLPEGIDLAALQRLNRWLLASGLPIEAVNRIRQAFSLIKGGRLAGWLQGQSVTVLMISDVAGDDPAIIGSGLLQPGKQPLTAPDSLPEWLGQLLRTAAATAPPEHIPDSVSHRVVATLDDALQAGAGQARSLGYRAAISGLRLAGDALRAGGEIAEQLRRNPAGSWLWGGETTVRLPEHPGRGGRSQSLALAAALALGNEEGIVLLAAGTDGTDGNTSSAGAIIDGGTVSRGQAAGLDARQCLRNADAGRFLAASGDLINTGPTGTNVADLVIAIKRA